MKEANEKLKSDLELANNWFHEKHMVLNPDECHYMCLGTKNKKY